MEHGYPLSRLSAIVATVRARTAPMRLSLRNSERFGLLHLYFSGGRLVAVEGHRDTPLNSLADLATWQNGVIRRDEVETIPTAEPDPRLETLFAHVLRELAARGVLAPPARARSLPSQPASPSLTPFAASAPDARLAPSPLVGALPPLADAPLVPVHPPAAEPLAQPTVRPQGRLVAPQWQLIALAVRQVLVQASAIAGGASATHMFHQALLHAARAKPILAMLTLDPSGWLVPLPADAMTHHSRFAVADAVAALLEDFEAQLASVIGAEQAQATIVAAVAPFRAGLAQIGFAIST
jgi:hypothetical protein